MSEGYIIICYGFVPVCASHKLGITIFPLREFKHSHGTSQHINSLTKTQLKPLQNSEPGVNGICSLFFRVFYQCVHQIISTSSVLTIALELLQDQISLHYSWSLLHVGQNTAYEVGGSVAQGGHEVFHCCLMDLRKEGFSTSVSETCKSIIHLY